MDNQADDRLLDHNYDGIQEYDNPMPGWWVNLFWITIIFSIAYVAWYHIGMGPSIHEKYENSRAAFVEKQAEKYKDLVVSEKVLTEFSHNPDLMAAAKLKFEAKCATCHGAQGAGLACPNLTDDHYLHGPELMNFYTVIRDGVKGKQMKGWLEELGPYNVMLLASYVGTMAGSHVPNGRDPEGILFVRQETSKQ